MAIIHCNILDISSGTLVFQNTLTECIGIATIPVLLWDKYSYFGCHGRLLTSLISADLLISRSGIYYGIVLHLCWVLCILHLPDIIGN